MICEETDDVVADPCEMALSTWQRFCGLMLRRDLPQATGMLFPATSSIHTCFMRFPIDVIYMAEDGRVVKIVPSMRPWRVSLCTGARSVLELPAGTAERVGLKVGDTVYAERMPGSE
jgi:hypothetical protein